MDDDKLCIQAFKMTKHWKMEHWRDSDAWCADVLLQDRQDLVKSRRRTTSAVSSMPLTTGGEGGRGHFMRCGSGWVKDRRSLLIFAAAVYLCTARYVSRTLWRSPQSTRQSNTRSTLMSLKIDRTQLMYDSSSSSSFRTKTTFSSSTKAFDGRRQNIVNIRQTTE